MKRNSRARHRTQHPLVTLCAQILPHSSECLDTPPSSAFQMSPTLTVCQWGRRPRRVPQCRCTMRKRWPRGVSLICHEASRANATKSWMARVVLHAHLHCWDKSTRSLCLSTKASSPVGSSGGPGGPAGWPERFNTATIFSRNLRKSGARSSAPAIALTNRMSGPLSTKSNGTPLHLNENEWVRSEPARNSMPFDSTVSAKASALLRTSRNSSCRSAANVSNLKLILVG